jgi:hypothetical protein
MIDDDLIHAWLRCLSDNAWCALHYEDPALNGQNRGEIFGGGYVRRKLEFSAPANRTIWQVERVKFIGLNPNRLTHFGIWNHKQGGKLKAWGILPDGGALIAQGQGYVLPEGSIAVSLG